MSGYLQRLAANARKSGGAIHPLMGSMYSTARVESQLPVMEEEEIIAPRTAAAATAITDEPEPRSVITPLVDQAGAASPVGREETRATDPVIERLQISSTRPLLSGSPKSQAAPTQTHSAASPERLPLPSHEPHTSERHELPRFRPILAPHTEAKQRMAAPIAKERHAGRQMETPDEIQIHIGRIEVTAAPPPAPRPAPPQKRKSLDLAEYLKGGRGRAS